ncbi:MAG TPA: hypothetical protein VFN95_13640 [Flavitalea sp.]|nr:hypothetical protein [Flavitalea sp.]
MNKKIYRLWLLPVLVCWCSCSTLTYNPHSAKQKYFARPHVQFMMAVVDFREKYGVWPPSLSEMEIKSVENKKIINDFQYRIVDFRIRDNDNLTAYFYDYKKISYYGDPEKIDLNAFHGRIKFYKSEGKFVWKVKMK